VSRERRVVRPYRGLGDLQHLVDGLVVDFGQTSMHAGDLLVSSPQDFLAHPVTLCLAEDGSDLADLQASVLQCLDSIGLQHGAVELVVILSTPRLKTNTVVKRIPIDDLNAAGNRVLLGNSDSRPIPLQAPHGGCYIRVYLCLNRQLERAELRPWRKGTWLAKAQFHVKTDLGSVGFTPLELTEEVRKDHELAKDTIRFALVEEPLAPGVALDGIRVFIDPVIMAELAANPGTGASRAFQIELFLMAMSAAIYEGSRQLALDSHWRTFDQIEGSILARIISLVIGDVPNEMRPDEEGRFFKMAVNHPGTLLAHVEARVPKLREFTRKNVREGTK